MTTISRRLERHVTARLTRQALDRFLRSRASDARTLDLGGGSGPYAHYFPNRLCMDVRPTPDVHFVGDAHRLPLRDGAFGVVLCTEVLEHLSEPRQALDEMFRVLGPGGRLLLTTRFLFPIHESPHDYYRYTRYGLEHLLQRFEIVTIEEETDTMGTLGVLVQRLALQADVLGGRVGRLMLHLIARLVACCGFILRREYGSSPRRREERTIMTSGYYVEGRRR
jgi:SAM-dependent methyltransferase